MPTRATAAPIRPPRESAQWPKTLAETGAPTGRARRRRGRVGAALGVVAVLAVILTAALVASATGLVTLPGPQTQAPTQASPSAPAPSATATLAPTATAQDITPAANLQQVADQRAYNSFHSATLGHGSDASCASANASTSFSTGQPIYINLCTSASVAANALGVTVRQIGKSVCTLSPVQSNTSYYCHSDYSLDPGRYDIIVTMKVNGTQATARDLPFTVVK